MGIKIHRIVFQEYVLMCYLLPVHDFGEVRWLGGLAPHGAGSARAQSVLRESKLQMLGSREREAYHGFSEL